MRLKRLTCILLTYMLFIGIVGISGNATEIENPAIDSIEMNYLPSRTTGSFSMSIPPKSKLLAKSSFPLAAWETVTIKASYSPFSANVDFGLIDPNGTFYYFNVTNGSIDRTIQVNESGNYRLQVRNNSSVEVEVSGFVNY